MLARGSSCVCSAREKARTCVRGAACVRATYKKYRKTRLTVVPDDDTSGRNKIDRR